MKVIHKNPFIAWIKVHSKVVGSLAAGLVIGAAGSAIVGASIPDAGGQIHACYTASNVRIIDDSSESCGPGETALNWNQTGPEGFVSNLVGANLSGASLEYRNFAGMDLHDATLDAAHMRGSNFTGANLSGIWMRENATDVTKVNFTNVNFTDAHLQGLSFQDSVFTGADFTNASLTNMRNANFAGMSFPGVSMAGEFNDVNLSGVDFRTIIFQDMGNNQFQFTSSNLSNGDFRDFNPSLTWGVAASNLTDADFTGADLTGTYIVGNSNLFNTNFTNANFTDASFANSGLSNANLTGVTWNNTTCPDTTNSNDNEGTCIGHLDPL